MSSIYNVYCDESCHMQNDHLKVMVLGAIWCPHDKVDSINNGIREIKKNHRLPSIFETKWVKVSPAKVNYYLDLVDYFFKNNHLHFRCLVVPNKSILDHAKHAQTHDVFYYKMYFEMLKTILDPEYCYRIYLDIKDTRGGERVRKLHEVLCNSFYDFDRTIIEKIQIVRSSEIEIIQLADLLIGAVSSINRGTTVSTAKGSIIDLIKSHTHYSLTRTTLYREEKFNILVWHPREEN